MDTLELFIILCCFSSCLRLLLYRRNGDRFKRHFSILAYLAILITGSLGLALLTHKLTVSQLPPVLLIGIVVFTVLICICQGNIACLFRLTHLKNGAQ